MPTPEPSKCVFNEITPEEFDKMEEERKKVEEEEDKKEKPLCNYPLVATVTSQVVQVNSGIFPLFQFCVVMKRI